MTSLRKGFDKIILIRLLDNPKWLNTQPNYYSWPEPRTMFWHHKQLASSSSLLVLVLLFCHL